MAAIDLLFLNCVIGIGSSKCYLPHTFGDLTQKSSEKRDIPAIFE
jgi:hypothetical protein